MIDRPRFTRCGHRVFLTLVLAWGCCFPVSALAQQPGPPGAAPDSIDAKIAETLASQAPVKKIAASAPAAERPSMNLLELLISGGPLMWPIGFMSVLVIAFSIERALALRRSRVIPRALIRELGDLGTQGRFDPRQAYRICQQYPSTTATIIRAMLLKVGRPHAEVEQAVNDVCQREASRLYNNIRTLNLAASVTPLMGLLGTVWGMIEAFFATANLAPGANRAEELASGIYVALVTTLGGLTVAIPAVMLAHYFEGKIQKLFHEIDELLFNLLPQVERFEGKMRVGRQGLGEAGADPELDAKQPISAALK